MEITIILLSFIGMEAFSWFIHKYVMHGVLWNIHKTHHGKTKGFFELNDIFSLFFGSVAFVMMALGAKDLDWYFWMGFGISLYGVVYFILHDVVIHKRVKFSGRPFGRYFKALADAHRDHHKSNRRDGAVSFGLLWVSRRYFKK